MQFKKVIGNSEVKQRLMDTINSKRISHAQLFLGKEGSGAFPMALAYAQAILCKDKQSDDSCGVCEQCIKMQKLGHPDVHFSFPIRLSTSTALSDDYISNWRELTLKSPYFGLEDWHHSMGAENKQSTIGTKESTNIVKKISLKSFEGGYKILIMWMPENMNTVASNKLLKIIEEPPAKTLFILVAEDQESLIATIRSRTQIVKIPSPSESEVSQYLQLVHTCEPTVAENLSHLSERNIALAERMIVNELSGSFNLDQFISWMRFCYKRDITETVNWVDVIAKAGREDQKAFLKFCLQMFRQCIVGHYTGGELTVMTPSQKAFLTKFAPFINHHNIVQMSEAIEEAHYHIERNANPKILFLDLSLKIFAQLKKKL
jgi:DNA polymerase-3 subunit delta'